LAVEFYSKVFEAIAFATASHPHLMPKTVRQPAFRPDPQAFWTNSTISTHPQNPRGNLQPTFNFGYDLEPPNSIVKGVPGADLLPCALSNFRGKGKLVHPSTSSSTDPPSLQGFTPATRAQSARATKTTAKARLNSSNDPFGARRFERSKAKTLAGYARVANSVLRELIGLPLTREQQDEIRAQRPKLRPEEIDKNAYRHAAVRERAPRDMAKRRRPGWVCRQFILPLPIVEGLMFLAKAKAQEEFAERRSKPRGLRRRYPKTANFYVTEALNYLLAEYGFMLGES
jgi:hypothetical protein